MPLHLPHHIVGIDTETTSLNPESGEIIEVAAIRYNLATGREVEELHYLLSASQPLSADITAITGITNAMIAGKQRFSAICPELQRFLGGDLIFAHNASFDLSFLHYHGCQTSNPVWDTFVLAGLAWPEAESYNLGSLCQKLGIEPASEHRAGDDVRLTWQLLQAIRRQLRVSPEQFATITRLLERSNQTHYLPAFEPTREAPSPAPSPAAKATRKSKPASASAALNAGGAVSQAVASFQARPQQIQMAAVVEALIKDQKIGFIEASTGIGKTYAYLVPALLAARRRERIVIATYTKNLQDQLIREDIPVLTSHLPQTVALLKGRRNYICMRQLNRALARSSFTPGEAFLLLKIWLWIEHGGSGDSEQLNLSYQNSYLLYHLHADNSLCRRQCARDPQSCPYQRARRHAQQASVVVINHALLAQGWLETGGAADEIFQSIIVDEAHHFPEALRDASARDLSRNRLELLMAGLQDAMTPAKSGRAKPILQATRAILADYDRTLAVCTELMGRQGQDKNQLRLTAQFRRSRSWHVIQSTADELLAHLQFALGQCQSIAQSLSSSRKNQLNDQMGPLNEFTEHWQEFFRGNESRIQWISVQSTVKGSSENLVSLHDVILDVTPLAKRIADQAKSLILTSATLRTNGTFSFIKRQTGYSSAEETIIPPLFNYRQNMLIYLTDDGPLPRENDFVKFTATIISRLSRLLAGRILVLLTSKQTVQSIYQMIIKELNIEKIKLYAQNLTGGRHNILQRFERIHASVLLGASSFWEGVDVPGESLSCVVIPKLPFPLPDDPVIAAVAEHENVEAFTALSLPTMLLTLQQGIGRLLRTPTDVGVVVILDSRLHRQGYAADVLQSLPPATIHIGSHHDMTRVVTEWFGTSTIERWRHQLQQPSH